MTLEIPLGKTNKFQEEEKDKNPCYVEKRKSLFFIFYLSLYSLKELFLTHQKF